jgi:hypothetical protein
MLIEIIYQPTTQETKVELDNILKDMVATILNDVQSS